MKWFLVVWKNGAHEYLQGIDISEALEHSTVSNDGALIDHYNTISENAIGVVLVLDHLRA